VDYPIESMTDDIDQDLEDALADIRCDRI